MRLSILDRGQRLTSRILFAVMRTATRQPVPDILKLNRYRADFFGQPMMGLVQAAMRGPSSWSVGDRELMAAFVSRVNQCEFWIRAHAAVAAQAYRDEARVAATLADLDTAPIEEPLRVTLRLLRTLTREHAVDADDMRAALAAGVSREQITDALAVCFAFNAIDRLADAFGFAVPEPDVFKTGAKFLLLRGYRWLRGGDGKVRSSTPARPDSRIADALEGIGSASNGAN
jgi:uncharacterized peroxidase-related enzyme